MKNVFLKRILANLCTRYNKTVNYVTEEGADGIWKYRKWDDGGIECWGVASGTYDISQLYAAPIYYTSTTVDFPANLFVEPPQVNVSRRGVTPYGLVSVSPNVITKDSLSMYIINSGAAFNSAEIGTSIYARGVYKGKLTLHPTRAERGAEDTTDNYVHDIENAIDKDTNTHAEIRAYASGKGTTSKYKTYTHYTYAYFYFDYSSIPAGAIVTKITVRAPFAQGASSKNSYARALTKYHYTRLRNDTTTEVTSTSNKVIYSEPVAIEDLTNYNVSISAGVRVEANKTTNTATAYNTIMLSEVYMEIEYEMRGPNYVPPATETTETES